MNHYSVVYVVYETTSMVHEASYIVLLIYSIKTVVSLQLVGIYTAKEIYICVTCEKHVAI